MLKIQKTLANDDSKLYVVATPIGNLQEITFRALDILKTVDYIAAEDTRVTKKLCHHFDISTPLLSYHSHNLEKSGAHILKLLQENKSVALVSDAGYPAISDPGQQLVSLVLSYDIAVVPISGASALLNGLVASGLVCHPFVFHGFLPSSTKQLRKTLLAYEQTTHTMIFYVSVHKLMASLQMMYDIFKERDVCLAREISKVHEQFYRGKLSALLQASHTLKGEYVLIVSGQSNQSVVPVEKDVILETIEQFKQAGLSSSGAIKQTAKQLQLSRNQVYQLYHQDVQK